MALSKEEVLDAIADMSVMDVVQLVEAMEEKVGVSAAARAPSDSTPAFVAAAGASRHATDSLPAGERVGNSESSDSESAPNPQSAAAHRGSAATLSSTFARLSPAFFGRGGSDLHIGRPAASSCWGVIA